MSRYRLAYTLVETITVIGILGVLIGLLLPAVQNSRDASTRLACQNQLRQIGLALHNHCSATGYYPGVSLLSEFRKKEPPESILSWMTKLLPYLGEESAWIQASSASKLNGDPTINPPHTVSQVVIKTYVCPSDARLLQPVTTPNGRVVSMTSYMGNAGTTLNIWNTSRSGVIGLFYTIEGCRPAEITDGTSQTVAVGERPPPNQFQAGEWYQSAISKERFGGPNAEMIYIEPLVIGDPCVQGLYGPGRLDNPCDRTHYWSLHRSGSNFLFVDGSVHFFNYSSKYLLPALLTIAGGETVEIP